MEALEPMLWIWLGIIGGTGRRLLLRWIIRGRQDYWSLLFLDRLLSWLLALAGTIWLVASGIPLIQSAEPIHWAAMLLAAIVYSISIIAIFKASQTVQASERVIVDRINVVFLVVLGLVVLGEAISPVQLLAAGLLVAGAVLAMYRPGQAARWNDPNIWLIVLSAGLIGLGGLFGKIGTGPFHPLLFVIPTYMRSGAAGWHSMRRPRLVQIRNIWKAHGLWPVAMSVVTVLNYVAFLMALETLPLAVTGPMFSLQAILVVLAGMVLLGEWDHGLQKIAGALMAFIGMWLISA